MGDELQQIFLEACGNIGPLRLNVEDAGRGREGFRDFPRPFAVVGRAPGSDLVLDGHDVGKRHAYLQVIGGRLFFVDLGSRTGVYRGNVRFRSGWLGVGESIRIGSSILRAQGDRGPVARDREAEHPNPLEATGDLSGDWPEVTLEFLRPESQLVTWRMNRLLVLIGRSSECRVRLEGAGVSSFHCSLLRTPRGLWAVDLLGRSGVRVNGRGVRFARLGEGDELSVGSHRIRVRSGPPPAAVPGTLPALLGVPGLPTVASKLATTGASPRDLGLGAGMPELAESILGQMTGQFNLIQQQMFGQFQQTMMMMAQMFGALHRDQAESVRVELERLRQLNQDLAVLQEQLVARTEARAARGPGDPAVPSAGRGARKPAPPSVGRRPVDAPEALSPVSRPRDAAEAAAGNALHSQLNRRIAEIQNERQGRWQRLIDLMIGNPSGGPIP